MHTNITNSRGKCCTYAAQICAFPYHTFRNEPAYTTSQKRSHENITSVAVWTFCRWSGIFHAHQRSRVKPISHKWTHWTYLKTKSLPFPFRQTIEENTRNRWGGYTAIHRLLPKSDRPSKLILTKITWSNMPRSSQENRRNVWQICLHWGSNWACSDPSCKLGQQPPARLLARSAALIECIKLLQINTN